MDYRARSASPSALLAKVWSLLGSRATDVRTRDRYQPSQLYATTRGDRLTGQWARQRLHKAADLSAHWETEPPQPPASHSADYYVVSAHFGTFHTRSSPPRNLPHAAALPFPTVSSGPSRTVMVYPLWKLSPVRRHRLCAGLIRQLLSFRMSPGQSILPGQRLILSRRPSANTTTLSLGHTSRPFPRSLRSRSWL